MGVLSTVSAEGEPWGAAIYFVVDDNFTFYFVTRVGTRKYQNLESRPVASLTIADGETQTTVQAYGNIEKVPVQEYMDTIFDKLAGIKPADDSDWHPPLTKVHEGNYMPLKLTPSKLQFADFKQHKPDMTADFIETIIP